MTEEQRKRIERAIRRLDKKMASPQPAIDPMQKVIGDILSHQKMTFKDLQEQNLVKIINPPWMPLSIEYLGKSCNYPTYSVTHYGEQYGDLMADPDMTFYDINGKWHAASYRNDYVGVERNSMWCDNDRLMTSRALQVDQDKFARIWAKNIRQQGFVTAKKEK